MSVENLFHALREQLEYRLTDRPELAAYFAFERSFGRSDAPALAQLDSLRGVGAQRAAIGPGNLALALHAAGNSDLQTSLDSMRQSLEERIRATPEFRALVALEKAMAECLTPTAAAAPVSEQTQGQWQGQPDTPAMAAWTAPDPTPGTSWNPNATY